MTSRRTRVSCPNCQGILHIRAEKLGREGLCKYCGHRFLARADQGDASAPMETIEPESSPAGTPSGHRELTLEVKFRELVTQLAGKAARQVGVFQELQETRRRLAHLQEFLHHLRADCRLDASENTEDGPDREPGEVIREAVAGLRDRALRASGLEAELQELRRRAYEVLVQVRQIRSRAGVDPGSHTEHVPSEDTCDALDRLHEEVAALSKNLAASPSPDPESTARLADVEAERDALAGELGQLRDRLSAVEAALETARAEHDGSLARSAEERRALEAAWERSYRTALLHVRTRLSDLRGQIQTEQKARSAQEENAQQLVAERDALARDLEEWKTRLETLEQTGAETEADLRRVCERWEAEWARLQDEWEEQRREFVADVEQLTSERDTLSREVGELRDQLEVTAHAHAEMQDEHDRARRAWEQARIEREAHWTTEQEEQEAAARRDRDELLDQLAIERRAWAKKFETVQNCAGEAHSVLVAEVESLREFLEATTYERDSAKERFEGLSRQHADLAARLASTESTVESLGRERDDLTTRLRSTEAALAQANDDLRAGQTRHEAESETLRAEARSAGEAAERLRAELDRLRADAARTREERDQASAKVADLTNQHTQAVERSDALRTEIDALRSRLGSVEAALTEAEQNRARAEAGARQAQEQVEAARAEVERLRRDQETANQQWEHVLASLRSGRDQEQHDWTHQLESLRREHTAALGQERDRASTAEATLRAESEALRARLQSTETARAEAERSRARAEDQARQAEAHAAATRAEIEELQHEQAASDPQWEQRLASLRARWDEERREWSDRLDALRQDHEAALRQERERADALEAAARPADREARPPRDGYGRVTGAMSLISRLPMMSEDEKRQALDRVRALKAALQQRMQPAEIEWSETPRPRSQDFDDPDEFRVQLAQWLRQAEQHRHATTAELNQIDSDLRAGRAELELLSRDLALCALEEDEEDALPVDLGS